MDISKCTGELCPIKDLCKRFTVKASEYQSYIEPPFRIDGWRFKCDLYYPSGVQFQFTPDEESDIR